MVFIFLILKKDKYIDNSEVKRHHQRIDDDFQDVGYREFDEIPKKEPYVLGEKKIKMEMNNVADEGTKRELQEAKARIEQLEKKLAILEGRIPQKYPDVQYLGYKERKRILVSKVITFKDKLQL